MTKPKLIRWHTHHHVLNVVAHVFELTAAIVIMAAGQNLFAELVGADPDITPPSVPTGLTISGQSATEIDITWTPSTDDVGVVGYHVYRNGTVIGTATSASYSDTGLTPNTSYGYTVSAYDAASNESAQSSTLNAATLADTSPPSVPNNLHQTGATISSITLAWNPSNDNVGVVGYNIYRNGALIKTQSGTTYTDNGLAVYTNYNYSLTAFDAAGNVSNLSTNFAVATAQDTSPPTVPDSVQETGSTVSTVSLSWAAATDNVGVAGYHVYRNGVLVGSPGGTTYTDTGLTDSSNYTYTVNAYDAAGNQSAQSEPFSATSSDDTTPPTIPTSLVSSTIRDSSVTISWTASTDNVGVVGYKLYRNGGLVGTTMTTSFQDTGLSPVTTYSYTVKAYDAANNVSAASAALPVETAYDTTPPSVPMTLAATTETDTSVSLSWAAATDNIAVSGYNVYRGSTLITSTVGTTYTDSGLGVHTSYTYRVQAYDTSNNLSAESSPTTVSTLADSIPPTAPTNLTSLGQTTTSIDLSWSAATDDVAVYGYNIYRAGSLVGTVGAATLTFSDNNLLYNTNYSYTVTAVDAAGNESVPSVPLATATLPDTTPPVVSLTTPSNNQTVSLTVPISASASDDLALAGVIFSVDGTQIANITTAPFTLNWNSYAVHNGSHTLTATAYDASGNTSAQSITIAVNNPPPAITGDLNGDHKVNIYDLSILLSNWNKSGQGDFENTGHVNIFDLSILLSHYGQDDSNYN